MKIVILGANGMLGHKLYQVLKADTDIEVYGTIRGYLKDAKIIPYIDVHEHFKVPRVINVIKPDVVINCIGLVKQNPEAEDKHASVFVNAWFPHELAQICNQSKIRLIHVSTDCVFSGASGNYEEEDIPNPTDLYGYSKLLGEVDGEDILTIRTSMIGPELRGKYGLLEWLLKNRGKRISGFTESIFSGFTTYHLSLLLKKVLTEYKELTGLYHIASEPIDKYSLLEMINQAMRLGVQIEKIAGVKCNRSLNGTKFNNETGFQPPDWPTMVKELAHESNDNIRY